MRATSTICMRMPLYPLREWSTGVIFSTPLEGAVVSLKCARGCYPMGNPVQGAPPIPRPRRDVSPARISERSRIRLKCCSNSSSISQTPHWPPRRTRKLGTRAMPLQAHLAGVSRRPLPFLGEDPETPCVVEGESLPQRRGGPRLEGPSYLAQSAQKGGF